MLQSSSLAIMPWIIPLLIGFAVVFMSYVLYSFDRLIIARKTFIIGETIISLLTIANMLIRHG